MVGGGRERERERENERTLAGFIRALSKRVEHEIILTTSGKILEDLRGSVLRRASLRVAAFLSVIDPLAGDKAVSCERRSNVALNFHGR